MKNILGKLNVMIDIETMGTTPRAPILSIGAAVFSGKEIIDTYSVNIDWESNTTAGRIPDMGTVRWWMQQSEEARDALLCEEQHTMGIEEAMLSLKQYLDHVNTTIGNGEGYEIWANGPDFDLVIVKNAYDSFGMEAPWDFRRVRCFRTAQKLFNDVVHWGGGKRNTAHVAVDDAVAQATHLLAIQSHIGYGEYNA